MDGQIYRAIEASPIIPAVKNPQGLEEVLSLEQRLVFLLYGDICTVEDIIRRLHGAGKLAVVHADLIAGLGGKEVAVDFLHAAGADGIISTRPGFIRRGKELGLFTVLRMFVFDSLSLANVQSAASAAQPDLVEILPGIMPRVIAHVAAGIRVPLICGGLIAEKSDVVEALSAGALGVSATAPAVWRL